MELIDLYPNDDDIFDQSEAEKLSQTDRQTDGHTDRKSTYCQALLYEQRLQKFGLIYFNQHPPQLKVKDLCYVGGWEQQFFIDLLLLFGSIMYMTSQILADLILIKTVQQT